MKEILRSNNPVELSWTVTILAEAGIEVAELDQHASVVDGSINAIQRRLMVVDDDFESAQNILNAARAEQGI